MTLDLASFRVSNGKLDARLAKAMNSLTLDAGAGSVAVLTATVLDPGSNFLRSGLAVTGTSVTWRDDPWQVGAVEIEWTDDNRLLHTFTCRSSLARRLRAKQRASVEKKVSPSEWVTRRVEQLGGVVVCQPTSKQSTIAQASGNQRQTDLDVIANLASDVGFTWVEWGNRLWFGSRYWAWSGKAIGQRTWAITKDRGPRSDAIAVKLKVDDDDTDNLGTGTVTLPYDLGVKVRTWDLLSLTGRGPRSGTWLVEKVSFPADGHTPVTLDVFQPRRPAAKAGSST